MAAVIKPRPIPPAVCSDLLQLRELYISRAQRLEQDRRRHGEPLDADRSERLLETRNDAVVDAISAETQSDLAQVEHALQRGEAGFWGVCETCLQAIEPARLKTLPQATQCAHCVTLV